MTINMTHALQRAAQQHPNRVATICRERRQTYSQLLERVRKLAGAFQALGIQRGERVGLLSLNSDRYLEVYLAAFWSGVVLNPANTRWSAKELAFSFNDCETTHLLIDDAHLHLLPEVLRESHTLKAVVHVGEQACPADLLSYEQLIAEAAPVDDVNADQHELAVIFYTGGTTGFPKGVMCSHNSLLGAALNRLSMGFPVGPVYLNSAPLFHLAGAMGLWFQLMAGGTHVFLPSFNAQEFMALVQTERVTDSLLVPSMIQMILDHPDFKRYDLSSLAFLIYGASPISETLLDRLGEAFPGLQLMQGYGMTELSGCVSYLPPHYHTAEGRKLNKLRSAGRAAALSEIKIVGEDGQELPRGQVGEIASRGMSIMAGYWNRPEDTSKTVRNGWVHSGDGAYMDEEGFIYIVDRMKDMIVSGGENVYSAEVENAVLKHPAVATCAVVGIPSERWGESVHAVVVLKAGASLEADELLAHCKTHIAGYKCPRSMEVRNELPLSGAGKIQKNKLRDQFWEGQSRRVA